MADLAATIEGRTDLRHEELIFGTTDPAVVADEILGWCDQHLGTVAGVLFYRCSAGIAIGLELEKTDPAVLKINQPHIDRDRLVAATAALQLLHADGFPAPEPLVEPTPLGHGLATAERLVASTPVDVHDRVVRKEVARGLSELIGGLEQAGFIDSDAGSALRSPTMPDALWPIPHDPRFDFERTAAGAEWIDEIATQAQRTLRQSTTPECAAHFDWRVENLAFRDRELVGVYDWESMGRAPEAVAVGQASAAFTTDWRIGHSTLATVDEMETFVGDYCHFRGRAFDPEEIELLDAANIMVLAYASRCEHSDRILHPELAPADGVGWSDLLQQRARRRRRLERPPATTRQPTLTPLNRKRYR